MAEPISDSYKKAQECGKIFERAQVYYQTPLTPQPKEREDLSALYRASKSDKTMGDWMKEMPSLGDIAKCMPGPGANLLLRDGDAIAHGILGIPAPASSPASRAIRP